MYKFPSASGREITERGTRNELIPQFLKLHSSFNAFHNIIFYNGFSYAI